MFSRKTKQKFSLHYFLHFQITVVQLCDIICYQNGFGLQFWQNAIHETFKRGERYNKFSKEEAKGSKHYYTISDKKHSHKIEFPPTNSEKNNTAILCSTICMFFFQFYFHHDLFLTWPTFCFKDKLENVYTKNILFLPFQK